MVLYFGRSILIVYMCGRHRGGRLVVRVIALVRRPRGMCVDRNRWWLLLLRLRLLFATVHLVRLVWRRRIVRIRACGAGELRRGGVRWWGVVLAIRVLALLGRVVSGGPWGAGLGWLCVVLLLGSKPAGAWERPETRTAAAPGTDHPVSDLSETRGSEGKEGAREGSYRNIARRKKKLMITIARKTQRPQECQRLWYW